MTTESSLPSYDRLFRDPEPRGVDDARSVYSPAAYLADLSQLLHDHFENPALVQRRPAIDDVPLDADNTYNVLPYLDIVNEVLAASLDTADTFGKLRTSRYPAALPFVRQDERGAHPTRAPRGRGRRAVRPFRDAGRPGHDRTAAPGAWPSTTWRRSRTRPPPRSRTPTRTSGARSACRRRTCRSCSARASSAEAVAGPLSTRTSATGPSGSSGWPRKTGLAFPDLDSAAQLLRRHPRPARTADRRRAPRDQPRRGPADRRGLQPRGPARKIFDIWNSSPIRRSAPDFVEVK